ncbi:flagellar hook-basal body complex protein [candidate division GN15 bacterium]|nr:flagellar hook-basal body complex protein [candidate division GN15 bacterium]
MMASLFAGVSGLKNHQTKLNVIGNNIANVNTIGFKSGRVNFQEALVQTFKGAGRPSAISGGTNPQQLGLGMEVATIDNLFLQGGLETTGQITDLAIQGSGFFVLGDNNDNKFYTRAGSFGFDADSNLVDPSTGLFVMGKMADRSGEIPSLATVGRISLPFGQQDPANATTEVRLANNINVSASDSVASLDYEGGSNVVTVSGTAFDGVGGTHNIEIVGAQAQNSFYQGANAATDAAGVPLGAGALTAGMTLGDLNVTDFSNFGFSVDGGPFQILTGLDENKTVQDLINAINQIEGITAELTGGEVRITRDKAGDPGDYYFTSTTGILNSPGAPNPNTGNIMGVIFGYNGAGATSGGGAAATFVATDTFTPDRGFGPAAGPVVSQLDLVIDERTGLVTGLDGLGGGGVEIQAGNGGLMATGGNNLIISTDPTLHSTAINVYDSQGGRHTLTIEFYKSIVENRWEWSISTLGVEDITAGQYGYVSFNSDGSLNTFDYFGGAQNVTIDPNNGAELLNIRFDAGTIGGTDGLTGYANPHTASLIYQDGYGLGLLEKIDIDQAGNISGIFSNGVTRILAQIMLADFSNQGGLRKSGRSMYQPSPNSGEAVEGVAGETISGQITSGALESSSVDIAQEFTNMITAQRGFQANARIITTSDQLLDELVALKR